MWAKPPIADWNGRGAPAYPHIKSAVNPCPALPCPALTHIKSAVNPTAPAYLRCGVVQCNAVWCGAVQCGAVRSSAVRCSAVTHCAGIPANKECNEPTAPSTSKQALLHQNLDHLVKFPIV